MTLNEEQEGGWYAREQGFPLRDPDKLEEPHKIQNRKVQSPAFGVNNPFHKSSTGWGPNALANLS